MILLILTIISWLSIDIAIRGALMLVTFWTYRINRQRKFLQLNCKMQLMEHDALNQQHVMQCYAIALIKSRRSLLVVGKSTG